MTPYLVKAFKTPLSPAIELNCGTHIQALVLARDLVFPPSYGESVHRCEVLQFCTATGGYVLRQQYCRDGVQVSA